MVRAVLEVIGDAAVVVALVIIGATAQVTLKAPSWLSGGFLLPAAMWIWWRGALGRTTFVVLVCWFVLWTAYLFAEPFIPGDWQKLTRAVAGVSAVLVARGWRTGESAQANSPSTG